MKDVIQVIIAFCMLMFGVPVVAMLFSYVCFIAFDIIYPYENCYVYTDYLGNTGYVCGQGKVCSGNLFGSPDNHCYINGSNIPVIEFSLVESN